MKGLPLLFITILISAIAKGQDTSRHRTDFNTLTAVYNTNDTAVYRRFFSSVLNDRQKIKSNIAQMRREFKFIGPVKLRKIQVVSATETDLTLQTENYGSWWNFLWITDSAKNFKEHHMRPTRFSGEFLLMGRIGRDEVLKEIEAYIDQLVAKKVFAGNVLIARKGKILYNKSFGNNRDGKPNDADTQFGLASMGKLFTTVSILQLADDHKLSLDDNVGKLLPALSNKTLYPITVRQLLTHTSGMGDYFEDPAFEPGKGRKFTSQDALAEVEKDKLHFAPGTGFRYSNTGFELLGLIIEKISGTSLDAYINQNIFQRVGMTHSKEGVAAGGALSTVNDIYNFSEALKANRLLSRRTTKYLSYHTADWGLGQEYQQLGDEVITGHSGGDESACTELNLYKNTGYTVVILSNTAPPYGHFVSDKIKELIVRKAGNTGSER